MKHEARVFVVDDDEAARQSLGWLMESVGLKVASFHSAQAFLDAFDPEMPGCLVLDVRMPGMGGLELQEKLAAGLVSLPVIIVTGHGDVPMAVRAMKAGAVDFLEKPFNDQALLDRIQQALEADTRRRSEARPRAAVLARIATLTPREREVMQLVVAGKPNKAIATALGISKKTVEAHRAKMMEKMQAGSISELVRDALLVNDPADKGSPESS